MSSVNMKLLGIVVLFNPDENVWDNIRTYIDGVDELILWLNSPIEPIPLLNNKQIIMGNGENVGIGKALNEAISYAMKNNYTHLLTMDQDSSFMDNSFFLYKESILNCKDNFGCFSPEIYDDYSNDLAINEIDTIPFSITSGSIYKVDLFRKTGLFIEDFFIDAIDIEFSFRMRKYGERIGRVKRGKLKHCLGNRICVPFLWGKLVSLNYSPIRTYYMIRNHVVLKKIIS